MDNFKCNDDEIGGCTHHESCADPDDVDDEYPDGYPSWHFRRVCEHCGGAWCALHCACDNFQWLCPHCGVRPTPLKRCPCDE